MRRARSLSVTNPEAPRTLKQFESFTLDTANECLWQRGARIPLPPKPFAVLRYLVENAGRLVSHDELLEAVWPEVYVQPQVLRTYMLELRRILGDDPRNPRFLRSVPKRGYCFVAELREGSAPRSGAGKEWPQQTDFSPSGIVGRDGELAQLRAAMQQAVGGLRQFAFLAGESGVGKTAVLEAFRDGVGAESMVAVGQCIPGFARQEYYPLIDALRQLQGSDAAAAVCSRLQPDAAIAPATLCAAVEEIARQRPLVLLLEDLQWADEATLHLLSALARRQGQLRLLVVATLAPQTGTSAEAVRSVVHDLCMRHLGEEIVLSRLGKKEVAAVVEKRLRASDLPEEFHRYVYQNSEGNPRFALMLVEHLISEGVLARSSKDGAWELRRALQDLDENPPRELARCIEAEIDRLSEREQRVLEAASIPPVAFPAWLVAAALDEDVVGIEEMCDEIARRTSLVKRAGEEELPGGGRSAFYVFAHALYREVLYRRQSPARRALRHLRIARRLREIFAGREALIAFEAAIMKPRGNGKKPLGCGASRRAMPYQCARTVRPPRSRHALRTCAPPCPRRMPKGLERRTMTWHGQRQKRSKCPTGRPLNLDRFSTQP